MKAVALHLGLARLDRRQYEGWPGDAPSAERDAVRLADVTASHGFDTRLLLGADCNTHYVLPELHRLAAELGAGDRLLLTFSGHGSLLPLARPARSWCFHNRQLLECELRALWSRFRIGVRIFVIADCCHAGERRASETKGVPVRSLSLVQRRIAERQRGRYGELQRRHLPASPAAASIAMLAACEWNGLAYDAAERGGQSLFNDALLGAWRRGAPLRPARSLFEDAAAMVRTATAHRMPMQSPQWHVVAGEPLDDLPLFARGDDAAAVEALRSPTASRDKDRCHSG